MKKIKFLLYIFCFFNILFVVDFSAALTEEQGEQVASFAENMIIKSITEHKDKNGFPLLAYSQNFRIDGMAGKLSFFATDDRSINELNTYKWGFDCASFVAYVYNHTLGIDTYRKNSSNPFTVANFVNFANHNVDFTYVMQNVKVPNIDFNKLQKGDLIIFVGEHIMIYIGNGRIAHLSVTAIKRNGSLGAEIVALKNRYPEKTADIIRIKDGRISANVIPNTIITWPDTGKKEDLGSKDELPKINITINNKIVTKYNMPINFNDDKGLIEYSINNVNTPSNWNLINKQLSYSTNYEITQNGTYYVYVKDTKNQITTKSIIIDFIDNTPPIIDSINYQYNEDKTFNIIINATDKTKLSYSINDTDYSTNNVFNKLEYNTYTLKVKDEAGNITTKLIDLSKEMMQMATYEFDDIFTNKKKLRIKFNSSANVISYNITNTLNEPTEWIDITGLNIDYSIKENGVYYLWTRNNNGISVYQEIIIDKIDNKQPIIKRISIKKNKKSLFNITVDAYDNESGIKGYSLDNIIYQESSTFTNLSNKKYTIYIKDNSNNLTIYEYDLSNAKITNNTYIYILIILIVIVIVIILIICYLFKRKKNHY